MNRIFYLLCFICLTLLNLNCSNNENVITINPDRTVEIKTNLMSFDKDTLRIAVGGMITPKEGFSYYRRLLDYIEERSGRNVRFIDREDYAEINNMVKNNEVDVAFVCGGPYVDGHDEFGMELLVAPRAYGGTVYYSYIIVNADSNIHNFQELRGRKFAFTDPLSNTGALVPTFMLSKINETPESFFKGYDYTYAHDKSIMAVAMGLADGAAVDSLIWEYINATNPEYTSKSRIIRKSSPYGIPPVVVRKGLDPDLKEQLREIFLGIHKNGTGKEILQGMMTEKFVEIDNEAYDSIREMKSWLNELPRSKLRGINYGHSRDLLIGNPETS